MVQRQCGLNGLQAHRGRDDCVALLGVMQTIAAQLNLTVDNLLRMFAEEIALGDSFAQVSVLTSQS